MKNQTTTRFEVGMPVMGIMSNKATSGIIDKIDFNLNVLFVSFEDAHYADFSLNGMYRKSDNFITLFTLPEYEALKKLTDSFVDGTFGKEVQLSTIQPNFEPAINEPVISNGEQYTVTYIKEGGRYSGVDIAKNIAFENVLLENIQPVVGYFYDNGFRLLKEQKDNPIVSTNPIETFKGGETETPAPISGEWKETTDLLDEQGKPVYFSEGMEVGSLVYGKGKVTDMDMDNGNICVSVEGQGDYWHTLDGILFTGGNQTLFPIEQYNQITLPKLKPIQVDKPKADVIELLDNYNKAREIGSIYVISYLEAIANKDVSDKFYYLIQKCHVNSIHNCSFHKCEMIPTISKKFVLNVGFVFDGKNHDLFIHLDDVNNHGINISYKKNGEITCEKL